ncbi:hypothetical protein FRC02_002892, partial [Tulasnella sp. 418]
EEVSDDDNDDDEGPVVMDVHPTAVMCHPTTFKTKWEKQQECELNAGQELHYLFDSMEEYELGGGLQLADYHKGQLIPSFS